MTGNAGIVTTGVSLGCLRYFKNYIWIALEIEDSIHLSLVLMSFGVRFAMLLLIM